MPTLPRDDHPSARGGRSARSPPSRGWPALSRESDDRPTVSASANEIVIPSTSSNAKPRTIGIGERTRTQKPAAVANPAVAITGAPFDAASTAARGGEEPARAASTKRAWNWIA